MKENTMNVIIKKQFQELINFLVENKDKKVASILEAAQNMCSAKYSRGASGSAVLRNTNGDLVAILDYYFKRWMPVVGENPVEFGKKANTPTGFNNTCKEGLQIWSKHQREARIASADLLNSVARGEIAPENIVAEQEKIEEERKRIIETDLGFASKEEVLAYLVESGVELADTIDNGTVPATE